MPESRRLPGLRGAESVILLDGVPVRCFEGETVATVLLAERVGAFHKGGDLSPRQPFCNMGTCFECALTIDGRPLQRACLIPVRTGMAVATGEAV